MLKKSLSLLLALFIALTPVLVSCSDNEGGTSDGNQQNSSDTTSSQSAETEYEYTSYIPNANYDGHNFRILTGAPTEWGIDLVYTEEMTGETFNDSVYQRNSRIEQLLNITIVSVEQSSVSTAITQAVMSGTDDYDIAYDSLSSCAGMATNDYLVDMKPLEKLNLDMPWWDKASIDSLSVADRTFFAENDINMHYNEATWVLYFNKKIITDSQLESPYDLVRSNQWTMDKMREMMIEVSRDADGNGEMNAPEDYFGFSTHWGSYVGMLSGGGETLITKTESGEYVSNMLSERFIDVAMKIGQILDDQTITVIPDRLKGAASADNQWATNTFYNGHGLFYGEVIGSFSRLREMENDFGLIPFPKYESSQENYTCQVLNSALGMCIPRSYSNLDRTCDIIEAMAIDSHRYLLSDYFDVTITNKSMRDEDSKEMLEIIFTYRIYDLGDVYGWGSLSSLLQTALKNGGDGFASTAAKSEKSTEKAAAKAVEKLTAAVGK